MPEYWFIWDDTENVPHLAEHDVTPQEAAFVVEHPEESETSRTTGNPVAFGETNHGRYLMVVYRFLDDGQTQVYVETAYEVPRRGGRNRRRSRG